MRFTWLEALCVLTMAAATLQLPVREPAGTFFTLPRMAAGKATVLATNTPANAVSTADRSEKP